MKVTAWEEIINIPTYKAGGPDKNPMFLEKRVYQGSSGTVYPFAVIDKVSDQKENVSYKAVFMENQYLKIMILPELGGRIQMAYDKTNDYHFVYYNRVIKPALVGLAGPWISGGIEFNWPQHHRPGTFEPVDFFIENNEDGSITVWVSEIEKMFHTKGMAGFTLYPDKAYIEIKGKLYNRTSFPQTFLWWANPAVSVDETYQSVFPPDVHAVYDHGKRDVSSFPIATGTYYKVDYSPGTDISRYSNIPVPTSYMAVNSEFDFVGGYNQGKQAGILHVANHHISPGKKQWTWGCGEFGKAWDRQLTDEDGPYFELMTGMFTDNQPDFGWIMPNEERNFRQYFMPYKNVGYVKNATTDALVNLEAEGNTATIKVYVTSVQKYVLIRLLLNDDVLSEDSADLSPTKTYQKEIPLPDGYTLSDLKVIVLDNTNRELVSYSPVPRQGEAIPVPASYMGEPETITTIEGLYLAGLHLEQYRHATFSPVPYYEEALRRDPGDIRCNNALGLLCLRRGQFSKSEKYFAKAIETQTRFNPNPQSGDSLFNLGLAKFYQAEFDEAYKLFYKPCWNAAFQDTGFLYLARIDAIKGDYSSALNHVENSIIKNYHGFQSRHLKSILLRKLGRSNEAEAFSKSTLEIDPFEFGTGNELYLVLQEQGKTNEANAWLTELNKRMRNDPHNYIEIAIDYGRAGFYNDAIQLLDRIASQVPDKFIFYYQAYFSSKLHQSEKALSYAKKGFEATSGHIFLNRLEDIAMLKTITALNESDHLTWYHLGNLWYDKRQYDEAINAWEMSEKINNRFPTTHRNLGIAYFNRLGDKKRALESYYKSFYQDVSDSRIFFELDQVRKRLNHSLIERYNFLQQYSSLVNERDDLYIEFVSLQNLLGKYKEAIHSLATRNFHPWEGGEGKTSGQHIIANVELAKQAFLERDYEQALKHLTAAQDYPLNLGEGKLFGSRENDIHYWLGCVFESLRQHDNARYYWELASEGLSEPAPAIFYNDQQPDKIFYQGLALTKLQRSNEADQRFRNLIQYGQEHINDNVKIDYFAVSLPDLMIFDDDLNKRNREHCEYLIGLGMLGLGQIDKANYHFENVLALNAAHQGAKTHLRMINEAIYI